MSDEFKVAARRAEPFPFHLSTEPDYEYEFAPQKLAGIVLAVADGDETEIMRNMFDWISDGLSDEQATHLIDHFKDPASDFDMPQLGDLFSWLQDKSSGRPTTSAGDSSRSRKTTGRSSTAGRRRKASTRST